MMIDRMLAIVTPATLGASIVAGIALGLLFFPTFGDAMGAAKGRRVWSVFVGTWFLGVAQLGAVMVARIVDGSELWPAWLGLIMLWTLTAASAAAITLLTRREP